VLLVRLVGLLRVRACFLLRSPKPVLSPFGRFLPLPSAPRGPQMPRDLCL